MREGKTARPVKLNMSTIGTLTPQCSKCNNSLLFSYLLS